MFVSPPVPPWDLWYQFMVLILPQNRAGHLESLKVFLQSYPSIFVEQRMKGYLSKANLKVRK